MSEGFTLKEILLRIEAKLDAHLDDGHPESVSRRELYSTLVGLAGLVLAGISL